MTRILLVDHDPTLIIKGEAELCQAGFEVIVATSADEAQSVCEAASPDIVIIDIDMPDASGFEACRLVRAVASGEDIPIVVMTERHDFVEIKRAYDAGATDFVVKPIEFNLLVNRLRYMQRATAAFSALRDSERRLASAQRIAKIGHWEWAVGGETVDISPEAGRVLGVNADDRTDLEAMMRLVHPDDRDRLRAAIEAAVDRREPLRIEHRVQRDGDHAPRIVYQEGEVGREEASGKLRLIATIQDISERKEAEQRIVHLTNYDAITGLPNHQLIADRLERVLAEATKSGAQVGILAIDPDQFKRINDSLGHKSGDAVIRAYADRLCMALRSRGRREAGVPDLLGRSDHVGFIAVLCDIEGPEELELVAQMLSTELAVPYESEDRVVYISSSFGLARYPGDGATAQGLLEAAGVALHEAKIVGRGSMSFYDNSLDQRRSKRLSLETRLRRAIDLDAFRLVFQPKVRTSDLRVVGAEALLRWTDPELGPVGPDEFIPVAEECGLITSIDAWVLERSCLESLRWVQQGLPALTMSVNVSAAMFEQTGFLDLIQETIQATGIPANLLELELTERTLMKSSEASIELLHQLRGLGVRIALDDFGTGYSSLSYLTRYPIDTLKIDRSFVTNVHQQKKRAAIVGAIIAMSKSIDIRTVAEGVENKHELKFLADRDCDEIQGFYFAKPMPPDEFVRWVWSHTVLSAVTA